MAEVVQEAQQEFWQSPVILPVEALRPSAVQDVPTACTDCGTEFMIGARFCHTCGRRRPIMAAVGVDTAALAGLWARNLTRLRSTPGSVAAFWNRIYVPDWLHYLHFHEIKRSVGLPTAALVAFIIGMGCVAGAVGVSLFYKASNLAEFQAIQMWRIEWLLAATASFVAGILLKKPSEIDPE
jgi:hypothetical protein